MKLPIKFRGKTQSGKIFHGDLIHRFGMVAIGEYGDFQEVEPNSVKQLVGYDKNGKMIYSDDKVRLYVGELCIGIEIAGDFIKVNDVGKTFDNVELLEEAEKNGNDI